MLEFIRWNGLNISNCLSFLSTEVVLHATIVKYGSDNKERSGRRRDLNLHFLSSVDLARKVNTKREFRFQSASFILFSFIYFPFFIPGQKLVKTICNLRNSDKPSRVVSSKLNSFDNKFFDFFF